MSLRCRAFGRDTTCTMWVNRRQSDLSNLTLLTYHVLASNWDMDRSKNSVDGMPALELLKVYLIHQLVVRFVRENAARILPSRRCRTTEREATCNSGTWIICPLVSRVATGPLRLTNLLCRATDSQILMVNGRKVASSSTVRRGERGDFAL